MEAVKFPPRSPLLLCGEATLFDPRGAGPGGDVRFCPTPLIFRSG
ncbi:MAG: hypothetical protein N3B16_07620 [Candidatus Aminicenantes bacterium]|nr:hypothetical protein [Candidatus Aminicenantes bacterium]